MCLEKRFLVPENRVLFLKQVFVSRKLVSGPRKQRDFVTFDQGVYENMT